MLVHISISGRFRWSNTQIDKPNSKRWKSQLEIKTVKSIESNRLICGSSTNLARIYFEFTLSLPRINSKSTLVLFQFYFDSALESMLIRIYTDSILGDFAIDQFDHWASIIRDCGFIFNLNQIAILESFIFHTHRICRRARFGFKANRFTGLIAIFIRWHHRRQIQNRHTAAPVRHSPRGSSLSNKTIASYFKLKT